MRIFIVLCSTFVVVMPNIVKSLKFNIFMIRAFWEPKIKLVKRKSAEIKII